MYGCWPREVREILNDLQNLRKFCSSMLCTYVVVALKRRRGAAGPREGKAWWLIPVGQCWQMVRLAFFSFQLQLQSNQQE